MRNIRIEKITLNIGFGTAADKLEKAKKLLHTITGKNPVPTMTQKRIPTWNVRPGLNIGVKVTVRGSETKELLKRLLAAKENILPPTAFDAEGNFSFGIPEYMDIPGIEYLVEVGMMGLEVAVTVERPGYRIKKRRFLRRRIPVRHKITPEETIAYLQKEFNINVGEKE